MGGSPGVGEALCVILARRRVIGVRALRDRYMPVEFRVTLERRALAERQVEQGGARSPRADTAPMTAADASPSVTEGGRPDDPDRLARRPTGLIGSAARGDELVSSIAEPDMVLVEREQREMETGKRREFSPQVRAVLERMDAELQRGNAAFKARQQQMDLERSRAAACAARGD